MNPVRYVITYIYFKTNVFKSHDSNILYRILYQSARLHFVKLRNDRQSLKNALCVTIICKQELQLLKVSAHLFVSRGLVLRLNESYMVLDRMLEPNTYECPIRTIRTYWAEILIFD